MRGWVVIKVSLVVPLYQSWEMLRRQVLYWNSLKIPKTIEIIIADDGSDPEPELYDRPKFRHQIVHRANKQDGWTIPHILNFGAKHSRGQYIMFLGIDHIISPEWVSWAVRSEDDYAVFTRKYALLADDGTLLKIQFKGQDCNVDYTSIGWVSKKLFNNVGKFDEEVNGINKDVNFFKRVARALKKSRLYFIRECPTTFVYMLPEKKDTANRKGRTGEHWKWMSHLRPVNYLHRLPDRHRAHREAAALPYDGPDNIDELFSFVGLNGAKMDYKFTDLITWKHPAEVAWMLGDYR
jgi:glycosyltransferase involved in cell wall biosynthesis